MFSIVTQKSVVNNIVSTVVISTAKINSLNGPFIKDVTTKTILDFNTPVN